MFFWHIRIPAIRQNALESILTHRFSSSLRKETKPFAPEPKMDPGDIYATHPYLHRFLKTQSRNPKLHPAYSDLLKPVHFFPSLKAIRYSGSIQSGLFQTRQPTYRNPLGSSSPDQDSASRYPSLFTSGILVTSVQQPPLRQWCPTAIFSTRQRPTHPRKPSTNHTP